jgi:hypothetical protein
MKLHGGLQEMKWVNQGEMTQLQIYVKMIM